MILMIDPPVFLFSEPSAIRDWQAELTEMRARYARDPEALSCIALEERSPRDLLVFAESQDGYELRRQLDAFRPPS